MNRIRELRDLAGLTQDELGKLMGGIHKMRVSRLENSGDQITVYWLQKAAAALKVHPSELLGEGALTQLHTDVEPFSLQDDLAGHAAAIAQRGLRLYRVTGFAVELTGIVPGKVVTIDETEATIAGIKAGDVVLVQARHPVEALALRQYLPPKLLLTNHEGQNTSLHVSEDVKIVGVVIPEA